MIDFVELNCHTIIYCIVLTIIADYPVIFGDYNGGKRFIISNTSWLGGKNSFLGYAYLVVGSLCLVLWIVFLIIVKKYGQKYVLIILLRIWRVECNVNFDKTSNSKAYNLSIRLTENLILKYNTVTTFVWFKSGKTNNLSSELKVICVNKILMTNN